MGITGNEFFRIKKSIQSHDNKNEDDRSGEERSKSVCVHGVSSRKIFYAQSINTGKGAGEERRAVLIGDFTVGVKPGRLSMGGHVDHP